MKTRYCPSSCEPEHTNQWTTSSFEYFGRWVCVWACGHNWPKTTSSNLISKMLLFTWRKIFPLNNGHLCGSLMIELLLNIFDFLGWKKIKIYFFTWDRHWLISCLFQSTCSKKKSTMSVINFPGYHGNWLCFWRFFSFFYFDILLVRTCYRVS